MNKSPITKEELYPTLSQSELAEAKDNLERYLALLLRIFERVEVDRYPQPDSLIAGTGTLGSCTPPQADS